jgi:hypothetical protein
MIVWRGRVLDQGVTSELERRKDGTELLMLMLGIA